MYFNQYEREAQRTARIEMQSKERLVIAGLGITGEAGEVADIIKKHAGQGHELDREKLIKELGDVLWYITEISAVLGIHLEEVAEGNIKKLKKRYPNGFESEKSINR